MLQHNNLPSLPALGPASVCLSAGENFCLGSIGRLVRQTYDSETETTETTEQKASNYTLLRHAAKLLPAMGVASCLWKSFGDQVHITAKGGKAALAGVVTCGSVWACPVCSAKIARRRQAELEIAVSEANRRGLPIALLTLTMRHAFGEALAETQGALKSALRRFRRHRHYATAKQQFFGSVTVNEVTRGVGATDNGWHPHAHILLIGKPGADLLPLIEGLRSAWLASLRGEGRDGNGAAFDVRNGHHAGAYIAKWGVERELTAGHAKQGRRGGDNGMDLLRKSHGGDLRARRLFVEYAEATKGRCQLRWSPGLKLAFGVEELSDREMIEREDGEASEETQILLIVTANEWLRVRHFGIGEMLAAAETGRAKLLAFLGLHPERIDLPPEKIGQRRGATE